MTCSESSISCCRIPRNHCLGSVLAKEGQEATLRFAGVSRCCGIFSAQGALQVASIDGREEREFRGIQNGALVGDNIEGFKDFRA